MAHEEPRETLLSILWRVVALLGIAMTIGAMLSSDGLRYGTSGVLRVPVLGVEAADLVDSFSDPREGERLHQAIDIPAPHGTPVVAATAGPVHRMFSSARGGLGVYQIDPTGTRCLYYAHLDGYTSGLEEGQLLSPGDSIGYVGTTGNAPDELPHLHFAVMHLSETTGCADGRAVNPIALFR